MDRLGSTHRLEALNVTLGADQTPMPVAKLFWDDPYLTVCDATVAAADTCAVMLDRTVFFARSGGQASDTGSIAGIPVLEARTDGLDIRYVLGEGHRLSVGDPVRVEIDWPERNRLIRLHFAAELVLELVNQRHGRPEKRGADITPAKARIDFAWDGNISAILGDLESEMARIIGADLPITSAFEDVASQRRYWEIEGFARVPCGGTHPRSTAEVGRVRLKRVNPGAGTERIEITLDD